jgi:branched-chain amino acid transport system permease protein
MTLVTFLQLLINATLLGGIYSAVALGFSLVWGIMNLVNIAHGSFIILGAYITWALFEDHHLDPFLTIPISMVALFVLGYCLQRFVINYVIRAPQLSRFFITIGFAILLENLLLHRFTGNTRSVTTGYSGNSLEIGGVNIPYVKLATLIVSLLLVAGFQLFLTKTRTGNAIRSTGMDLDAARLTGVKIAPIFALTFGLSAMLAGATGSLLSTGRAFSPDSGSQLTQYAFMVAVLGGLGSMLGVVVGGFLLAAVQVFTGFYRPAFSNAVAFALLLALLFVKPEGLLGKPFYSGKAD